MQKFLQKLRSSPARQPLFSGAMLLFAILFTECVLFGGLHLAACVLFLAFGAFTSLCFWRKAKTDLPFSAACAGLAAAGSLAFSLNGNGLISGFLFFFLMVLYAAWASAFAPRVAENRGSWRYLSGLVRLGVLQPLAQWPEAWRMLLMPFKERKSRRTRDIFVGLLIAVPVCIVAIVLLGLGDDAFSGVLQKIWDAVTAFDLTVPWKIVLSVLIWPFFVGFVLGVRRAGTPRKETAAPCKAQPKGHRMLSPTVSVTVLSALCAVYVVYLFSQLSYFFSAFASLLPEGYQFSYAEYARRGFFEMCLLTLINFSLLCAALLFTRRPGQKISRALQAAACTVCAFTLLFIATSLAKIMLYVSSYGLTTLRLYTAVFDAMLLLCTVCLGVHLFWPKWKYMRVILPCVSAIFIVFALADADRIIAHYNTERYLNGTTQSAQLDLDIDYLNTLDSAAVPYLEKIYLHGADSPDYTVYWKRYYAWQGLRRWRDKLCTVQTENGRVMGYEYKYKTSPAKFCLSDYLAVQVLDRHCQSIENDQAPEWPAEVTEREAESSAYQNPTDRARMQNL